MDPVGVGADLATRLASGDPDVVRDLYEAYGRLAYFLAFRILHDAGHAEEAVQIAYIKLWRAASRVDPGRDIRPLLFTIVRRSAFDVAAANRRQPWTQLDEQAPLQAVDDDTERSCIAWTVRQAIDELPDCEREVVRLQHLEGLSQTEVAERMGISVGTVKSRSFRAHKRLASLLSSLREEAS
jgi:RNA polymerase sigma factor (sigma-70 family)